MLSVKKNVQNLNETQRFKNDDNNYVGTSNDKC